MSDRPYVTLSCAVSMDGYLDTAAPPRLMLSNVEDLDRVDQVRSEHDAIMVGASTVRRDNPRLIVRADRRRDTRQAAGLPASPHKVTVTTRGDLDASSRFFTTGTADKLVYTSTGRARRIARRLGPRATVVGVGGGHGDRVSMAGVLEDLVTRRGVHRLVVEGGGVLLSQFLGGCLADELHLVIAPIVVGDPRAPRLVGSDLSPWMPGRAATLAGTRRIGDVVLLRYALSERFDPVEMSGAAASSASAS